MTSIVKAGAARQAAGAGATARPSETAGDAPDAGAGGAGRAVHLTGRGAGLLAATAVTAFGAAALGYRELTLLAAAGATALVFAGLAVVRSAPLAVELRLDRRHVERGDQALLTVTVANPGSRRAPPVAVTWGCVPALSVPALVASASCSFEVALDTRTRGVLSVGPAVVRRADRFGLIARAARTAEAEHLHVWPRPRTVQPLQSPRSRDAGGPMNDGAPGGVMFNALREYESGDDLRRVHWPSSARRGALLVREHVDPSEPVSTVLLDTRVAGYPPGPAGDVSFDEAVDVAASVVLASTRLRCPVRLLTTSGLSVVGRRRRSDATTFLDALAVVSRHEQASLDVVAMSRRGGVGTLTVVTGTTDAGQLAAVAKVVNRFEQVVVLRVGAGASTPATDRVVARDGGTSMEARLSGDRGGSSSAGRLRVIGVRVAADLPSRWPSRPSATGGAPPPKPRRSPPAIT